jgi:hypothetical protein
MDNRFVSDIVKDWENRNRSRLGIRLEELWRRHHRAAFRVVLLTGIVAMAAAAAVTREEARQTASLALQLKRAEPAAMRRDGEPHHVRMYLPRLQMIHPQSSRHRIPADLAAAIYDAARREGIDPRIGFSLIRVESGFTRTAVSHMGAIGYTQVMPATAFWLEPGLRREDLFDRDTNLRLGFRYLRMMIDQYEGDMRLALLAYNRGPTRVDSIRNQFRLDDSARHRAQQSTPHIGCQCPGAQDQRFLPGRGSDHARGRANHPNVSTARATAGEHEAGRCLYIVFDMHVEAGTEVIRLDARLCSDFDQESGLGICC